MDWAASKLSRPKPNPAPLSSGPGPSAHIHLDAKLQRELARLDDSIPFNPVARHLHHTWAQTFFSRPELYFQPSSVPELQKIVTLARRCRKRLCVTGFGHSPSDLTCTSSWLVNLDNLAEVLEFDVDHTPGLVRFQAGLSLHNLNLALAKHGYTLPNLGSIDVQSVAGVISTGTHGSSLKHGLVSESITSLTVLLSNSQLVTCSATKNPQLFRAALLSLGSLGIIVEITLQAVPDFNVAWSQSLQTLSSVLESWDTDLWTQKEFTRVWWLPYLGRAVVWRGSKTDSPPRAPNSSFYGGAFGYYVYHNLLYLSNTFPRILPWIEWFVFGMQYGFKPGSFITSAVQPAREGLLMDCLYSQFVNEWALPLSKGPEAIARLAAWINHDDETARIPISSKGVWVHCPVEVRVTHTSRNVPNPSGVRPYLDPTVPDGPTLYLNATLYRPYGRDPPCHERYYQAFEYLMQELGGRPHWAKNFAYTTSAQFGAMYGQDMIDFLQVRDESDPDGMFLGEWHRRTLPLNVGAGAGTQDSEGQAKAKTKFPLMEEEVRRSKKGLGWGFGDGLLWQGRQVSGPSAGDGDDDDEGDLSDENSKAGDATPSPPATTTSEESFDYMAKGEASVYAERDG
ncbi:D-arabinono-1,4-lactone oxidase [Capronia epimyces CBS 606.96]|uniref:D-arabinono-1,4-lactone oxidase n=1 Tax=Capronia epimyces CBS 606.96 TaxID=1182542 RepID=W9YIF0_9EURO|nr:D-arabinono-1,4-lactone oxidase [Capronia epimyces CBS 606.96]EXJ92313.1 D-arabinono-1,4-lactone oxidase [Capronia epimyces CBS 606.96]